MATVLGIDLGTTSVKVVLYRNQQILAQHCQPHEATISTGVEDGFHEQDVYKIISAFDRCAKTVLSESSIAGTVSAVAICGQMHGCVRWSEDELCRFVSGQEAISSLADRHWRDVSSLVTWMDGRATTDFLNRLPCPRSHVAPRSGFGVVTLLWLLERGLLFGPGSIYNRAGTVQDLLVACLCLLRRPVMTCHNAVSWGYFDDVGGFRWNESLLQREGLPLCFLPQVVPVGSTAGRLKGSCYGVPDGVPVFAAFGDLQATVYQHVDRHTAVLNCGTSAQLCFQMPDGSAPPLIETDSYQQATHCKYDYFPFFNGRYLVVAASLNGGNVLTALADKLCDVIFSITGTKPLSAVWKVLIADAVEDDQQVAESRPCCVQPWLFGERYDPTLRAAVTNLTSENISVTHIFRQTIVGIISNLHSMLPLNFIETYDIRRLKLTGEAAKDYFRKFVEKFYADLLKVVSVESVPDGAVGSAAYVAQLIEAESISTVECPSVSIEK